MANTSCDALTKQLADAEAELTRARATGESQAAQLEEVTRKKHELEVEYRSYQEHHSSSNHEQMHAISELKQKAGQSHVW